MKQLRFTFALFLALVSAGITTAAADAASEPTILITGSNRGIGLEFTKQYAELGWNVIATTRNPANAADLQTLALEHKNISIKALDITDHRAVDALAAELNDQPVDILLNNAALLGEFPGQYFGQIDYQQFERILAVNTIGTLKMSEAFAGHVERSEQKKIVTLGSAAGSIGSINGHPDLYAYRASKAALHLLMRNLSFELQDEGIMVGLINPGLVDTRGFADMLSGEKETPDDFKQIVSLLEAGVLKLSTPEEAVKLMIARIDELGPETSGVFINADGAPIPW